MINKMNKMNSKENKKCNCRCYRDIISDDEHKKNLKMRVKRLQESYVQLNENIKISNSEDKRITIESKLLNSEIDKYLKLLFDEK
jgi:hypothetical protein